MSKAKVKIKTNLKIGDKIIETQNSVDLLGIEFDYRLKLDSHINDLCRKAGGQLNSLFRFQKYLSSFTKKLSINSFIFSNFNYCSLVWHFCPAKSRDKIEQIQTRAFKF